VIQSRLERYRLEHKISGDGSFGDVWLARDTLLDRRVAIKRPKAASELALCEQFLSEARMLARLNHPNITQIYDAEFDEGEHRFYLVMEYLDGRDLGEVIREEGSLSLQEILDVSTSVLRALSYAHKQGIVHRDIKPSNVMLIDTEPGVKLLDFGLADLKSILRTGTEFLAGTPAYIAPEQIQGQPVDGRADLYSLGVMLYEMITGGRLPFECVNEVEMLAAHMHAAPIPPSQFAPAIAPDLERCVLQLLARDPGDRYLSAEDALEALSSVASLGSADDLVPAVAHALGVSFYEGTESREELFDRLRQIRVLLLRDSFEYLLNCPGPFASAVGNLVERQVRSAGEVSAE
jgi:serine/threonine protein kinase